MTARRRAGRGLGPADLVGEALSGALDRPLRGALTAMGTVLGVGAVVAVLGLTATAGNQISRTFTLAAATQIRVSEVTETMDAGIAISAFPADADERVRRISGVEAAGVTWTVGVSAVRGSPVADAPAVGVDVSVVAASAGYLSAAGLVLHEGAAYTGVHETEALPVAVLGARAAASLGVTTVATRPVVTVDDVALTVIGIIDGAEHRPDLATAIVVPAAVARTLDLDARVFAEMLVVTRPGAAQAVAPQIPVALRPDDPSLIVVTPPPNPQELREDVETSIADLLLLLAGVSLVIGAFGIANTSTMSVMERTAEIGLRRALGAQRRDIAVQFMIESMVLGSIGGVVGSSLGIIVVLGVAVGQDWTAVVEPVYVVVGPLLGAFVGAVAGVYPARRAAQIEPVRALRS